ncbi:MAG: PEP-CTERM sorting domain-containing protein [Dechloromonas sp.]|nr:MAG: PEP-CTERM sorting domain-containing protein [Dechloromonas sp.]
MNMKKLLGASVVLLVCSGVEAVPITYTFTGSVVEIDPSLSSTFNTSQTLSGSFTYESSTAGDLYGSDASGFSNYYGALTDFVMTIGSYSASPPFGSDIFSGVQVVNNFGAVDRFVLSSRLTGAQFNGFNPLGFLSLDDFAGTAFSSTSLSDLPNLTGWPDGANHFTQWYLAFSRDGSAPRVAGNLTSITQVSTVPEPGSLALFASALAALLGSRIRRRWPTR